MRKIVYKIVARIDGKLYSAWMNKGRFHNLNTTYLPNQWAEPSVPGSPLYAFETLDDAKRFVSDTGDYWDHWCIWKAEAEITNKWKIPPLCYDKELLNIILGCKKSKKKFSQYVQHAASVGTVLASRIKLLEEIE